MSLKKSNHLGLIFFFFSVCIAFIFCIWEFFIFLCCALIGIHWTLSMYKLLSLPFSYLPQFLTKSGFLCDYWEPLCVPYAPCWELQDRGVLCPRFWRWLTPVSLVRPWCLTTHISRRRDLSPTLDSESSVFVLTAPMRFQSFFIAPVSYSGCTCSVDKVPCPRHVAFTGLL